MASNRKRELITKALKLVTAGFSPVLQYAPRYLRIHCYFKVFFG
jgi:hypothetical protein